MNKSNLTELESSKIPQNLNKNFKIIKSEKWEYSIEISFDVIEEIDYFNLYIILKSYILDPFLITNSISFCSKEENGKIVVFEKENVRVFKNMMFNEFIDWIEWRIEKDKKYVVTQDFYGIMLTFNGALLRYDLSKLLPKYPWDIVWLKWLSDKDYELRHIVTDIIRKNEEIHEKNKIIDKMEKTINELLNIINNIKK